jgi:hypothetical protein
MSPFFSLKNLHPPPRPVGEKPKRKFDKSFNEWEKISKQLK